jgi:hypothetical protein
VNGVSGSLTPGSLHKILTVAGVYYGYNFCDIGAGDHDGKLAQIQFMVMSRRETKPTHSLNPVAYPGFLCLMQES